MQLQGEIDNAVGRAKGHSRLGAVFGQGRQALTLSSGEDQGEGVIDEFAHIQRRLSHDWTIRSDQSAGRTPASASSSDAVGWRFSKPSTVSSSSVMSADFVT